MNQIKTMIVIMAILAASCNGKRSATEENLATDTINTLIMYEVTNDLATPIPIKDKCKVMSYFQTEGLKKTQEGVKKIKMIYALLDNGNILIMSDINIDKLDYVPYSPVAAKKLMLLRNDTTIAVSKNTSGSWENIK